MAFRLREYQTRCLEALGEFLASAADEGAKRAFVFQTERPYKSVPQLPEVPYVCLRVPTGGGKTIMAAHAVGLAAHRFLQRDQVVCLWLVPSNAILEQTLAHLRAEGDPYREALISHFGGRASVINLQEALYVQRSALDGETIVVVSTLAALRVEDTEGRKVYEQNGALEHHFTGLDPVLLSGLDLHEDGGAVESLANVFRLRHPVLIMDEAHTARTRLSFETLARFAPSCILEFTATPEVHHAPDEGRFASNVLAHVSAAELKAEEMIKLPVRLWTRPNWTEAVSDTIAMQRELEQVAGQEQALTGERIRPIVLFQAEARREEGAPITVEELERRLVTDHRIPAEQIVVATGDRRGLDGIDLTDAACSIRFIITVQALREGWDCPWAYVLCSVANQASPRAVEQILGRVLRLPGARKKTIEALNCSYAYVVSASFATAAAQLKDGLVNNGFERFEAERLVQEPAGQGSLFYATPETPVRRTVNEAPNLSYLEGAARAAASFEPDTNILTFRAPISEAAAVRLAESVEAPAAKAAVMALARESRGIRSRAPGPGALPAFAPLVLPLLARRRGDTLELFEESLFLDTPWRIAPLDPVLSEAEFPSTVGGGTAGHVDVSEAGRLEISVRDEVVSQLALLVGEQGWTVPSLAVWLDSHIPHPDLTQPDAALFIHRALTSLMNRAGVSIEQLARDKYRLRKALAAKMDGFRATQHRQAYQALLFGPEGTAVSAGPDLTLILDDPDRYAPNWVYEGAMEFRKHLFPVTGELKDTGEEFQCAAFLDQHPLVECWLRNLSRDTRHSFWLQTSTDRFYPDFVGRLTDGRVFAVESKGAHLWTADDAEEKRVVGNLWSERSGGRCLFAMPNGADWTAIDTLFRRLAG